MSCPFSHGGAPFHLGCKYLPAAILALASWASAGPLPPASLRCEYLTNPVGIDVAKPRLFWIPAQTGRAARQTAYQVIVSTAANAANGDAWDSGKQPIGDTVYAVYAGKPLESRRIYYWKVRYWDQQDQPSEYSHPATFETGILASGEWKAQWIRGGIGGGNVFRKEFILAAQPVRARAYVSGIGYYELRLNGAKVGDHVLDPGYTDYAKRVLYATYDVTGMLKSGRNAAGMMLGEGWFHSRAGYLQLEIDLANGTHVQVVTDNTWRATQGAILADSIYNGETYDARRELTGWDQANFSDAAGSPVTLDNPPTGVLSAQMMPPIRVVASILPVKLTSPRPGVYVFDMGQNFSGWALLKVKGPEGAKVVMRHAETIYDDGTINVENLRAAKATDTYILKGDPEGEVYEPRFTYHGFRYVELTGYPGTPSLATITGREVHTDVPLTGGFTASKTILNQLQHNIIWGTKTNLHSIPTDCNQRDERMGWMADAHLAAETAMLNFDMAAFYTNFLRSIHDEQDDDGSVPDTVPRGPHKGPADPAWGTAYPLLLEYMYQQYGDRRMVEQHFDGIRRWADYLHSKTGPDGMLDSAKYGDWVPIEPTPGGFVSTVYYYASLDITAKMAAVLGKTNEAAQYRQMADALATAFQAKFYHADTHTYATNTQSANILPLFFGITPAPLRNAVNSALQDNIVYYHNTHLTTGILGAKYALPVLTQFGRSDLAYELATQTTYPSWGYMVEQGATTIWELWQDATGPSMNSHNHPMFGSVGAWFYTALAGINIDMQHPGYERIRIEPQMARDLQFASGSLDTIRGRVACAWQRSPAGARVEATIPTGSTAEIHVPTFGNADLTVEESGVSVWKNHAFVPGAPGVTAARAAGNQVVIEVSSGAYVFESRN